MCVLMTSFIYYNLQIIHISCICQTILLIAMGIDAIVVLIRQKGHIRITKAFRPVFFIDSHYIFGVRRLDIIILFLQSYSLILLIAFRVMRQILLCLKPITDVLLLILFFVVFFSLLGEFRDLEFLCKLAQIE